LLHSAKPEFCALDSQAASDKVYQLLAHGRWFSPASSTTKTGRHDIAEILLKVAKKKKKKKKKKLKSEFCIFPSNITFVFANMRYT
jgi:hypothetical protein